MIPKGAGDGAEVGAGVARKEHHKVGSEVGALEELIAGHDVIFSLLDSREARWLPTVLAAKHNKLLITGALGFDTFLVMRNGGGDGSEAKVGPYPLAARLSHVKQTPCSLYIPPLCHPSSHYSLSLLLQPPRTPPQTACYYCSDIAGVGNTLKDRTVDQQCTVTRPGLSFIAAALAVEVMVSMLALRHKNVTEEKSGDGDAVGDAAQVLDFLLVGFGLLGINRQIVCASDAQDCLEVGDSRC